MENDSENCAIIDLGLMKFATVAVDRAVNIALDYLIPLKDAAKAQVGMRVMVPLRKRLCGGTILNIKESSEIKNPLPIHSFLSENSVITFELLKLATWMSDYYATELSIILKTMLPPSIRKNVSPKIKKFIQPLLSKERLRQLCEELRQTDPAQSLVLDLLLKNPQGMFLSQILEKAQVSKSPIESLIKKKAIEYSSSAIDISFSNLQEYFKTKLKKLNEQQQAALNKIQNSLEENKFQTHLIQGVTGSGKTEIYLQAIQTALNLGKGVIFLVPEIALTSQTIERLRARFDQPIALLHHRLSQGERNAAWKQISEGRIKIAVGARSAIFSPISNLGLIIVDEEHESSYKQGDERPRYHARDVAVMRGKLCQCTVVLASATPSLESYHNAINGKYLLSHLDKRVDQAKLPQIFVVDMKKEFTKAKGFTLFSSQLLNAIEKRIQLGEQTLLFLNRRGYHTTSLCPSCSHIFKCVNCDLSLTYHLGENILSCHLCDFRISPPRNCPQCGHLGDLKYKGVGTEMVEKALHAIFPSIRTLRLDADTTKQKASHEKIFKQFRSGKADVLIGTQMIAKGLHFPLVTLVGILAADGALQIPDFRASETVFQLLTQVSGRSGRGELAGEVIIQTHLHDHPVIAHAARQDYQKFYEDEIEVRKIFDYPPFSHLVKFVFSGSGLKEIEEKAKEFRSRLIQLLPPSYAIHPIIACGYTKVKGDHRFQCLVKGHSVKPIVKAYLELEKFYPKSKKVRLSIDVDPQSTYF